MTLSSLVQPLGLLAVLVAAPAPFSVTRTADEVVSPTVRPTVVVPPELRTSVLDLSDALRDDLRRGRWESALEQLEAFDQDALSGPERGALAFLKAWALVRVDRADEALPLIPLAAGGAAVPASWLALVHGEALLAADQPEQALAQLDRVPPGSGQSTRARLVRASVLRDLGRTKEAFAIYEELAAQPDPEAGVPEALLAVAARKPGSDEAYAHLRRIWEQYPRTEASRDGWPALKADGRNPTWQERGRRGYRVMRTGDWDAVLSEIGTLDPPDGDGSDAACQLLFAKGRSQYKKNRLSSSIQAFADIGPRCTEASDDWGARGLYLVGTAQFRRGQHTSSARSFASIPELYPESSYADDGYLHAGIALQEAGDLDGARELWRTSLTTLPEGDTTPESTWRLAWTLYLDGRPDEAIEAADALADLPLGADRRHIEAGRYWSARWRLYPDVAAPTVASEHPDALAGAVERWRRLCEDVPHSYYSILAYSRLVEVAPDVAAELATREPDHDVGDLSVPWEVRPEFLSDPELRDGIDLARLGLITEAKAAWSHAEVEAETGDEMAYLTELRILGGDWLYAHDNMRRWLQRDPPGTLGPREPQILRIAYPDRYWSEVQAAADGYERYEPRLFHALVREESNFNKDIRSFAGARGLSQLMPYTAKDVAGWLRQPVGDLTDPENNLTIGARYLESVHQSVGGSPFLALAGYNAGPTRVRRWAGEWGNPPSDEYVERIPFRETRGYVRRVTTTWQTYRYQFDVDKPAYPDLSRFNHQATPDGEG